MSNEAKETSCRPGGYTRGVATSFGFRKRPETAIPVCTDNLNRKTSSLDRSTDDNGNDDSVECLETASTGTNKFNGGATRLPAPKKEAVATRVSRFGFRQGNAARASLRQQQIGAQKTTRPVSASAIDNTNGNIERPVSAITLTSARQVKQVMEATKGKTGIGRIGSGIPGPNSVPAQRYTLQSGQLPRPQLPVRVAETSKTAKTAANINRKVSTGSSSTSSSRDSGVASGPEIPRTAYKPRPRHLDTVVRGQRFDVRDVLDDADVDDDVAPEIPLPRLPSVFGGSANVATTGVVRDRTRDIERRMELINDRYHGEEEKSYHDLSSNEKFIRSIPAPTTLDWVDAAAGEAMLDASALFGSVCVRSPLMKTPTPTKTTPLRSVLLTIEDPFAAVAANSSTTLLDDETSPQDSLISSLTESEGVASKKSAINKEPIKETTTPGPASPGTPTNTSLSLSDGTGRDFLIDDEIADQPALTFDESTTHVAATPEKTMLAASVDTLSPCESIASDDLMLDFEHSQSSGIDGSTDR